MIYSVNFLAIRKKSRSDLSQLISAFTPPSTLAEQNDERGIQDDNRAEKDLDGSDLESSTKPGSPPQAEILPSKTENETDEGKSKKCIDVIIYVRAPVNTSLQKVYV